MFRDLSIFSKKCLVCNNKNIYKYNICRDCYDNLDFNTNFEKEFKYLDNVYICLNYNNFIKEIMWKYKYKEGNYYYKFFGEIVIEKLFENNLNKEYNTLTFIPMHKNALKKRGYNQSELIGLYISENIDMELSDLLYKKRNNKKQAGLSEKERYDNVFDLFGVKEFVLDKNILIIDDVITTGYTLDFAAKCLKKMGAKKVAAIVAATHKTI